MVKNILILVFIFCFFNSYAQEPAYTPMRLNYQFRGIKVDSLFLVPSFTDTTSANSSTMKNVAGAMIRTGNDFWMRNAATTAWLQNVNVGNGASYPINSPDRINGTATANVTADLDKYTLHFFDVGEFKVGADFINCSSVGDILLSSIDSTNILGGDIKIDGNDLLFNTADTIRMNVNAGSEVLVINAKNRVKLGDYASGTNRVGDVKYGYAKNNIDLSGGDDTAHIPGTYVISNASTNTFYLPDATLFPGQTFHIINYDASAANLSSINGAINDATNAGISTLKSTSYSIITSDGTDYWIMWHQP